MRNTLMDLGGCRSNEFQCATSKRCISESLKCNQEENCDDGSDEKNCKSVTGLRLFENL